MNDEVINSNITTLCNILNLEYDCGKVIFEMSCITKCKLIDDINLFMLMDSNHGIMSHTQPENKDILSTLCNIIKDPSLMTRFTRCYLRDNIKRVERSGSHYNERQAFESARFFLDFYEHNLRNYNYNIFFRRMDKISRVLSLHNFGRYDCVTFNEACLNELIKLTIKYAPIDQAIEINNKYNLMSIHEVLDLKHD